MPPKASPSASTLSTPDKKKKTSRRDQVTLDEEIIVPVCGPTKLDPDAMMKYSALLKRKALQDKLKQKVQQKKVLSDVKD